MSSTQQPYESALQDCEFDHVLGRLEQQLQSRDYIQKTLQDANAIFAAQVTQPDGFKFMDACDQLAMLLDKNIPLEPAELQTLVQVLQIGFAMQENALNNRMLTGTQRSNHQIATAAFYDLCTLALDNCLTTTDLWLEVYDLQCRAAKARDAAVEEFGLLKYMGFDTTADTEPSATKPLSRASTPSASLRNTAPRSTKLREKALAMLNERPTKTAPLGRAHTMPTLSSSEPTSSSRSRRGPSKAHSRGNGLQVLQEE